MISQVSYPNVLNIKPVKTYPENSGRETTITAFKEILDSKKDKIKKEEKSNRKKHLQKMTAVKQQMVLHTETLLQAGL